MPGQTGYLELALAGRLERFAETAIDVAVETGDPIGMVLAKMIGSSPHARLAARLHDRIPRQTAALREVALEVTLQTAAASLSSNVVSRRAAALLSNLSQRLVDVGQLDQALVVARHARARLERLAERGRAAPDLYLGLSRALV